MDASKARSIFAGPPSAKRPAAKEEPPINFKSTNESLVRRNLLYKQQLAQCTKTIETLRDENVALRQRNQELIDAGDERKIELIVEQRVQRRLAHAAVLNKRLVQVLQQTGSELSDLFKGLEPEPSKMASRRAPKADINLERVKESPIKHLQFDPMEEEENDVPSSSSAAQNLENGTPKKKNGAKGRRSELFQDLTSIPVEADDTITEDPCPVVNRRAPMLIAPKATPKVAAKKAAPKSITRSSARSEKFLKPATPTVAAASDAEPNTMRRQRSAKMNIKSMKEPSLGQKLRRPGKHDEPMPYIGTFF